MTTKEIYESIDQSKISKEGKKFLMDVEEGTKGFTKQNDKVDKALLNLYKKLKEKKPEALKNLKTKTVEKSVSVPTTKAERKKEPKKETKKVTKKVVEASGTKKNTKPTKTPSTPKKGKQEHISTRASKLAKKEGITFKQARAKLSKEAKEDFKKEKKETDSELDKLLKFVRKGKFEDGEKYPKIYGKQDKGKSSVSADAKRMAKPVGKRVSKNGKTYYEYRDNRSDRNSLPAPKGQYKYKGETPPFLEAGGTLPTPFGQAGLVGETGTLNEVDLFAMGGGLPQGVHQYYANTYNPAYPTPHGYAEGGETEVRYTEDELKYALGVDDDYEDWVELAFQRGYKYDESKDEWYLPNDYAKGGEVEGGAFDLSLREKSAMYKYLDKGDFTEEKFMKMFGKNEPQTADIIYFWAESRGLNTPQSKRLHKASMEQMGFAKGGKTDDFNIEYLKKLKGEGAIKKHLNSLSNEDIKRFNSIHNVNNYKGGIRTIMSTIIDKDIQKNKDILDMLAKGGALKGSNRSTGESYGVVVGSKEVMEDGDVFINVRTGYNSRISESKLKFNNGNIEEITDYGYTLDGSMPDLSAGSGKGYNATTKAETIKVLSKLYNPSFAKKLIEYSKEKFADGGKIQISEVYNVNGKDYLFSTPIQNDKGTYTGWDAYEVVYDTFDGEKHLNYTKTKRGKSKYFPNGVKRTEAEDYFAKGGEVVGLHISRLHSDFPKGFENSGEVIKKGNNKFKVENGILLIKMGSSDWKEWRKITYAKGGKIDTSKKGVYLMELKDGTFKVSNNLGDRDFPYEFNDVFPTKERAMKFANRVAKNSKSKVVEIKYANGGKMKQGYNDRLDESLGNRNSVEPLMMQSYTDRRDESKGMEKSMGRRAYQSVGSMDKMAKGGKVNLNKLSDETYRMGEIDKKHSKRLFEISDDLADLDLGNKTYAKGGRLSTSDRYVLELAGLTGLRKNAIEELVKDNSLTESELLNIIVGVGRQQIKSSVVVSAVMDGVNSKANTNLVKFAKSEKAMRLDKGGEIDAFIMKFVKDAPASNLRVDAEELTAKLKKGGKLGFDGLANKVAKRYVGKPVKGKFQSEYGKTYSKAEAMEVGKKVAGKVYRQQQGMEAGGTLPTPFGQAGLVGETGTLNEVDLFAMGGGLPQGVQQYYGQTYNPAYPTPHGYAKGGAILKPRNKRKGDIGNRDKKVKVDTIYGDRAMKVIYYDLKGNPEKEEIVSYESGLERIKFDNLFSGIFDDYSRNNKAHYVFYRNDNKSHRDRKVVYLETKMYAKGGKIKFDDSSMMKKLWNERGFDIPYLESLSDSELKGLYDSEFDDERTYNFKTNRDEISNDYAKGGKTQGGKFYSVVTLISSKKRSKGDIQESMKMFVEQSKKQGYIKSVSVFDSYKGNPSNTDGMRAEVLVDYVDVQMLLNFASLFNLKYDSHKNYKKSDGKLAFAKGGKTQGYNDKLDESLGNTKGKRSTKEQNYKDRRNESEAMENKGGKRKYSRVNTMDKMAKGGATSVDTSDVVFFAYEEMMKKNKKFKSEEELYDFVNEGYAFPKYSKKAVKTAFKSLSEDFYAKGGKTQGYNDKLDESLGNTKGKRSTKEQNYKDRRNESEAMEKKGGKRKYASVKTMDKGNRSKRKTPMSLAKEIRKEGEKWQDAVKRASAMLKKV